MANLQSSGKPAGSPFIIMTMMLMMRDLLAPLIDTIYSHFLRATCVNFENIVLGKRRNGSYLSFINNASFMLCQLSEQQKELT